MNKGKRKKEIEPFAELEAIRKKEDQKRISTEEKKVSDFERSRVASEKLRLAWVKANITFIGLGFAVYKFYQSRLDHGKHPIGQALCNGSATWNFSDFSRGSGSFISCLAALS